MLLRAEIIHQKANELVRACGTRDTLRIAREIGIYVRFVDGLENLLGMYTYRHKERHICQFEPSANCWESVLIMILQRGQYSWIVRMRVIGWQMDTTVML